MKTNYKRNFIAAALAAAVFLGWATNPTRAQSTGAIPPSLVTPDKVETRIGTLEFWDGVPTVQTAEKVRDALDFTRALNAYNNSFRGASAYALGKGFQSIGAEDNTVTIFSELMDAKSLFLTANADTVYYMAVVNLQKGPMVIEQPPMGLGTINDMWFSWIIDIGFPGPDRGEGGKYLLVPPGYDGATARGRLLHRQIEDRPRPVRCARVPGQQRSQADSREHQEAPQDLSVHAGRRRHQYRDRTRRQSAARQESARARDQVRRG